MQLFETGMRLTAILAAALAVCTAPHAGAQPAAAAPAALGPPLASAHLAATRALGAVATSATLDGTLSANSAANVTTGANLIQGGAFTGASGLPVVIQNTGANVMIQNATVIHLQLK